MKKTVVLIFWMFLLVLGLLSWLLHIQGCCDVVYIGPPAQIDSAGYDHEAVLDAKAKRRALSEEKLVEYKNVYR